MYARLTIKAICAVEALPNISSCHILEVTKKENI